MATRTYPTVEREGIRGVAHGAKGRRPQPVGKITARLAVENRPSVFERHFWPFACGLVFLWTFMNSGDTILIYMKLMASFLYQANCDSL
jgi:hypothetical protein